MEEFLSAVHGRDVVSHCEMALDANGKALAVRVQAVGNTGAYATGTGILDPPGDRPPGDDQHLRHPGHRPAAACRDDAH